MESMQLHEDWFSGDYNSWDLAMTECTGYGAINILNKVKDSLLKVKNGTAVFERDSCLFPHIEYSFPLLTGLLYAATACKNQLNILDFGGSLGSSYFQNKGFLNHLDRLNWSIVEQKHFVDCGKEYFTDDILNFHYTIGECAASKKPDVAILSGVLSHIPAPHFCIKEIIDTNVQFIIIDRLPFHRDQSLPDRLTVQTVPPSIYEAKYPAWFFNEPEFLAQFKERYNLKESFQAIDMLTTKDADIQYKAYIFERKI